MHFSTPFLLSLLPSLTLSSPLPPQSRQLLPTAQTVNQDVLNIHNAVLDLDATVQSFTGSPLPLSLIEGTPVLLGVAKIHTVNRAGFRHALVTPPFTTAETRKVIDTVVSTVDVSIPASIQHLKEKAPAFKQGSLTITVIASLKLLLFDHDTFSAATTAKMDRSVGADKIKEGEDAVKNIHDAIQDGIDFFEKALV